MKEQKEQRPVKEVVAEQLDKILEKNGLGIVYRINISHNTGWRKVIGRWSIWVLSKCNPQMGIDLAPIEKK